MGFIPTIVNPTHTHLTGSFNHTWGQAASWGHGIKRRKKQSNGAPLGQWHTLSHCYLTNRLPMNPFHKGKWETIYPCILYYKLYNPP